MYQFAHNLIRMTLYDELRPARRRQLHRIVGDAVEVSRRADIDAVLPELARHFFTAGDIEKGIATRRAPASVLRHCWRSRTRCNFF